MNFIWLKTNFDSLCCGFASITAVEKWHFDVPWSSGQDYYSNFFRPTKVYKIRGSLERGLIQETVIYKQKNIEKFEMEKTILL